MRSRNLEVVNSCALYPGRRFLNAQKQIASDRTQFELSPAGFYKIAHMPTGAENSVLNQTRSRFSISGPVNVLACPSALVSAAE